jgi:hypothetical protein
MNPDEHLITILNSELEIELPKQISFEELRCRLAEHISWLIEHDFSKLVNLLYRVDVNEEKLKSLLHDRQDFNADLIIADLVIERQVQKLKSRQENKGGGGSGEEEW